MQAGWPRQIQDMSLEVQPHWNKEIATEASSTQAATFRPPWSVKFFTWGQADHVLALAV